MSLTDLPKLCFLLNRLSLSVLAVNRETHLGYIRNITHSLYDGCF
nr:MAG TPA: hypothetical protein [Caudoviricetes sp.]